MLSTKKRLVTYGLDFLVMTLGVAVYSIGVVCFTAPNNVAPGGVTGLATAINHLTGFPIGTLVTLINVPLMVVAFFFLGREYVIKSVYCVLAFGFFVDVAFASLPVFVTDKLLACLYGGALMGVGLGLVYLRQSSTGGTDVIVFLLHKWWPHIKMGTLILLVEAVMVAIITVMYGSIEAALYAVVVVLVSTKLIDLVLYGAESGKMIFVVSTKSEEISKAIIEKMQRGVTMLDSKGGYSGDKSQVLLCAVRTPEFVKFKKLVKELDPDAFLMVTNSAEIVGNGFKEM